MILNKLKIPLLLLLCAPLANSFGQYHNLYPCGDCAVYDNNGNDLKGFITSNKKELISRGSKVNEFSDNNWGYLQIKTAKTPSIDQQNRLNHSEYINTTLALYKTKDGAKATWWGRQGNNPTGPLVSRDVEYTGDLGMDLVRYYNVTHDLELKKMAVVEYYSDDYDQLDYDVLLKNYILVRKGIVKDANDYKPMIAYFDSFMKRFTYMEDPLLENKSFITFLTVNNTKYLCYFNIVHSKLAGHLEVVDIQYEKDKSTLVNNTFKKLTGSVVYVYGDDIFDLEKTFLNYGSNNHIKLIRRKINTTKNFNDDKKS